MASFRDMSDGRVRIEVTRGKKPDGSRNRASEVVPRGSKTTLNRIAREMWESLADPKAVPEVVTLRWFIERKFLPYEEKNQKVSANTYTGYESKLRVHVLPAHGDRDIRSIGAEDIDNLIADLYSKPNGLYDDTGAPLRLSPESVRHIYRAYSLAMKYARRWKYVDHSPFEDTDPPAVERDSYPDALSSKEAPGYFDAFRGHRLEVIVLLSLGAGLRPSEAAGCQWENITRDSYQLTRTMHQRGAKTWFGPIKTRASKRRTPLTPWVAERLWELRGIGPVCPGADGNPMTPERISTEYLRIARMFGLRRMTWHNLRHSFANILKAQGVPLHVISMLMRHSSFKTTEDHYLDDDMAPMMPGVAALDKLLRAS